MNKIAIIIPSRLDAVRLPNKPLKLINNKEMILHVYEAAKKTNTGEVYVATPDQKIIDVVKKNKGKAILTSKIIKQEQIEFMKYLKINLKVNLI
jgi:3-deoxy-manno-octulosonate cytidylyltransferase (CMP-KDO synthetase)